MLIIRESTMYLRLMLQMMAKSKIPNLSNWQEDQGYGYADGLVHKAMEEEEMAEMCPEMEAPDEL